jgi:hypothetical protein
LAQTTGAGGGLLGRNHTPHGAPSRFAQTRVCWGLFEGGGGSMEALSRKCAMKLPPGWLRASYGVIRQNCGGSGQNKFKFKFKFNLRRRVQPAWRRT